MKTPDAPRISRRTTLPLVWVVPLLAFAVGGWMIVHEMRDRGPEIEIDFVDGAGVVAGRTVLHHQGVAVGEVTSVELKPDLSGVQVRLRLDKSATAIAVEGSRFWIVHPEISLSGIRGLDTIFTGARLNVRPGKGARAEHFTGLDQPPAPEFTDDGKSFILQADRLGSLTPGAPVFYREVKVGAVETSRLSSDSGSVQVRIRVHTPYVDLVRTNTRFWNAGGFSFKVGLLGAELKNTSLESLVTGGVAFATPGGELAPPAEDGARFEITREADKAWLEWQPKIPIRAPEATTKAAAKEGGETPAPAQP